MDKILVVAQGSKIEEIKEVMRFRNGKLIPNATRMPSSDPRLSKLGNDVQEKEQIIMSLFFYQKAGFHYSKTLAF